MFKNIFESRLLFISVVFVIALSFVPFKSFALTNYLTNPGAETNDLTGWTVIQNGGNGWDTDFDSVVRSGSYSFQSSYVPINRLSQTVDLINTASGLDQSTIDTLQPDITISMYYKARPDQDAQYYFTYKLLAADGTTEIATSGTDYGSSGSPISIPAGTGWSQVSRTFSTYASGARYAYLEFGGKDTSVWAGNYGTHFDDGSITIEDFVDPTIVSLSPSDNNDDAVKNTDLEITFNEVVVVGTGNILIKKTSDNSTVETIDVTGGQVTGTGTSVITIDPNTTFSHVNEYYVTIPATAFDDASGNSFAGIASTTAWSFTIGSAGMSISPTPECAATATPTTVAPHGMSTITITPKYVNSEAEYYLVLENNDSRYERGQTISVSPTKTTDYRIAIVNMRGANFCSVTIPVIDPVVENVIIQPTENIESSTEESNNVDQDNNSQITENASPETEIRTKLLEDFTSINRRLRRKNFGKDVTILQQVLNLLDSQNNITTDGIFGSRTERVVKAFQKNVGLPVDGIVGVKTRAEIRKFLK
jgi:hypothetical protein